MSISDKRDTLTITLDGRKLRLVPAIIEGYKLEIDGQVVTSFLSKTPPIMRAVGALEARGDFGVGDLETASDSSKWAHSGAQKTDPAEND